MFTKALDSLFFRADGNMRNAVNRLNHCELCKAVYEIALNSKPLIDQAIKGFELSGFFPVSDLSDKDDDGFSHIEILIIACAILHTK